MTRFDDLKSRLRFGTATALIAALASVEGTASAQDQDQDTASADTGLEEVVITGSRIRRAGFDTVQPATVIDSEFTELRGFTNIAEGLNQLPAFGIPGASNNNQQAGNSLGQNFVNAFGLGAQRTLTLINGRRTVGQNTPTTIGNQAIGGTQTGLQVDLNIVPVSLIERVETVFTSGAPIYGADAVAATVNIILKDDFEGLQMDGQYGITEEGDSEQYRWQGTIGGNFADGRGNVVVSFDYSRLEGLNGIERPFLANAVTNCPNPDNTGASDGIADFQTCLDGSTVWQVPDVGFPLLSVGSAGRPAPDANVPGGFTQTNVLTDPATGAPLIFSLDGTGFIPAFQTGLNADTDQSIFFGQGLDGVNNDFFTTLGETNTLVSPLERFITSSLAHYDLTDNVRMFFEGLYARSEAVDEANQPPWSTTFFAPGQAGVLQVNIDDNPFLTQAQRDIIFAQTDADGNPIFTPGNGDNLFITRSNIDIVEGSPNFRDQDVFRFVGGFDGTFELAGREWSWEAAYTFGQTNASTQQTTINGDRFALAIDSVVDPDTGEIVCRSTIDPPDFLQGGGVAQPATPTDISACVPVNILGRDNITQEARDYLVQRVFAATRTQQTVIEFNIAGELFDLPAGPVGIAAGYTHRRERGSFTNDFAQATGPDPLAPVQDVSGGFNTNEVYGEVLVPIVSENEGLGDAIGSFVKNFEFEGAIRYVDNSLAGGDPTWTVGGRLQLDLPGLEDALTIRGSYTEAIRSPSIPELFLPVSESFFFASDPCDPRFIVGGPSPDIRAANCAAQFAAFQSTIDDAAFNTASQNGLGDQAAALANYTAIIVNASQPGTTGGNLNLLNEQSEAWTVGIIFEPDFIPGLTISADWTDIVLNDAITSLSATQIANACFDSPAFPNEASCGQFERDPLTFQFQNPATGQVNAAALNYAGLIVNVDYTFALEDLYSELPGTMNLNGSYNYIDERTTAVGAESPDNLQGEIGNEESRWQANLTYALEDFSFLFQWQHISGGIRSNEASDEFFEVPTFGAIDLFNATLRYNITENVSARVIVNNIFDVDGSGNLERLASGFGGNDNLVVDAEGRRYLFGLNVRF